MKGTLVRLALSVLLLAVVATQTDLDAALRRLAGADPGWLALALASMVVQIVAISWRWGRILAMIGAAVGTARALSVTVSGLFIGQALPTSVGSDAWRVWCVNRLGHSTGIGIRSVLLDRAAALAGLVVVMAATLPGLTARLGDPEWTLGLWTGFAVAVLLLGAASFLDRLSRPLPQWGWVRAAGGFARNMRLLLGRPLHALPLTGVSVATHLGAGVTVWLIARSLDLPIGLADCLVLMPPILLLAGLPMSVAGWGVREGAMVGLFGAAGLPPDGALPLSIVFGLVLLVVSLPGGALMLLNPDRHAFRRRGADAAG